MLAQNFEINCKGVLMWWHLSKAIENGKINSREELRSSADELVDLMLAATIRRIGTDHEVSDDELNVLARAKDARNYVAHQCVAAISFVSKFSRHLPDEECVFREKVLALAKGDNLISSWSYIFHEKQPSPMHFTESYTKEIADWVLAPLAR